MNVADWYKSCNMIAEECRKSIEINQLKFEKTLINYRFGEASEQGQVGVTKKYMNFGNNPEIHIIFA